MQKFYQLFILSVNSFGEFGVDRDVYLTADLAANVGADLYSNNDSIKGYLVVEVEDENRRLICRIIEDRVTHQFDYTDLKVTVAY